MIAQLAIVEETAAHGMIQTQAPVDHGMIATFQPTLNVAPVVEVLQEALLPQEEALLPQEDALAICLSGIAEVMIVLGMIHIQAPVEIMILLNFQQMIYAALVEALLTLEAAQELA